jgi:hypothetical protein
MPRTRAWRRHKRRVKFARRVRIVRHFAEPPDRAYKVMHWHLRCTCFAEPRSLERRREERAWRADEDVGSR